MSSGLKYFGRVLAPQQLLDGFYASVSRPVETDACIWEELYNNMWQAAAAAAVCSPSQCFSVLRRLHPDTVFPDVFCSDILVIKIILV